MSNKVFFIVLLLTMCLLAYVLVSLLGDQARQSRRTRNRIDSLESVVDSIHIKNIALAVEVDRLKLRGATLYNDLHSADSIVKVYKRRAEQNKIRWHEKIPTLDITTMDSIWESIFPVPDSIYYSN